MLVEPLFGVLNLKNWDLFEIWLLVLVFFEGFTKQLTFKTKSCLNDVI